MPIGKNALKRVNNGYSSVTTSAPDMENSEIAKEVKANVEKKTTTKKPATKKPTEKKVEPKSNTEKPASKAASKKVQETKVEDNRPDGFLKASLGDDLPVHLL